MWVQNKQITLKRKWSLSVFTRNRTLSEEHLNFVLKNMLFQDNTPTGRQWQGCTTADGSASPVSGACTLSVTIFNRSSWFSLLPSEYLRSIFPPKSTTKNFLLVVYTHSVGNECVFIWLCRTYSVFIFNFLCRKRHHHHHHHHHWYLLFLLFFDNSFSHTMSLFLFSFDLWSLYNWPLVCWFNT